MSNVLNLPPSSLPQLQDLLSKHTGTVVPVPKEFATNDTFKNTLTRHTIAKRELKAQELSRLTDTWRAPGLKSGIRVIQVEDIITNPTGCSLTSTSARSRLSKLNYDIRATRGFKYVNATSHWLKRYFQNLCGALLRWRLFVGSIRTLGFLKRCE